MRRLDQSVRRAACLLVDLSDPYRAINLTAQDAPPFGMVSVYRYKNAAVVKRLVDQCNTSGGLVLLWALDKEHPLLAAHTVGSGPGQRFVLLNRLAAEVPADRWLLVADDDVRFGRNGVRTFLGLCQRLDFDLAQPAHSIRGSHLSFHITRRRGGRIARETTFVEIGPVVAVGPKAREALVPFPEEGMGWGTELLWYDHQRAGMRLGVVDATPVRHLTPVGGSYDRVAEERRMLAMLEARGFSHLRDIQRHVRSIYRFPR